MHRVLLLCAGQTCNLALAVITGFARIVPCVVGAAYTSLVWGAIKRLGGPYVPAATIDLGAALVYTIVYLLTAIARLPTRPSIQRHGRHMCAVGGELPRR